MALNPQPGGRVKDPERQPQKRSFARSGSRTIGWLDPSHNAQAADRLNVALIAGSGTRPQRLALGYRDRRGALAPSAVGDGRLVRCKDLVMGSLNRIAPIFAVWDLEASIAQYERMGFATRVYEGGGYGYASRDGIDQS